MTYWMSIHVGFLRQGVRSPIGAQCPCEATNPNGMALAAVLGGPPLGLSVGGSASGMTRN